MDCVLVTNESSVNTSMSRCANRNMVGMGCADNMVRLWDMRVGGSGGGGGVLDRLRIRLWGRGKCGMGRDSLLPPLIT